MAFLFAQRGERQFQGGSGRVGDRTALEAVENWQRMTLVPSEVSAYLLRVGVDESNPRPTRELLFAIHQGHMMNIPFENLDVFIRAHGTYEGVSPISVEMPDIITKFLKRERGGWCYEMNKLLAAILRHLGYRVRLHHCRVLMRRPPHVRSPPTHVCLTVQVPGEDEWFLADVGFDAQSSVAPLQLVSEAVVEQINGTFRLCATDGSNDYWRLERQGSDGWQPLFEADVGRDVPVADFAVQNFFMATSSASIFTYNLLVSIVLPNGGRKMLVNNVLTTVHNGSSDANQDKTILTDPTAIQSALSNFFGIHITYAEAVQVFRNVGVDRSTR